MRLDRPVWVVCDPHSGVLRVCLKRKEAVEELRGHRRVCRFAVQMERIAGRKCNMPLPGKIVRLMLPGAGYDALYPKEK